MKMKQPTEQTRALVKKLQSLPLEDKDFFGRRQRGNLDLAIELINEIAASKEWPSVFALASYLLSEDKTIAQAAANGLESLLRGLRPSLFLQIDARLRGGDLCWNAPPYLTRWNKMESSDLEKFILNKTQVNALGMASFHHNGYVREAALKRLAEIQGGSELPFLLIRLSDWVPEVRQIAEVAVENRIRVEYLSHFLNNLALLERVKQRQREQAGAKRLDLTERVTNFLKEQENRIILLDCLLNKDYEVRRCCLHVLMESKETDPATIIDRVLKDKDLINRRKVIELSQHLSPAERLVLSKKLLKDRAPIIRRQALEALAEADVDEILAQLTAALLDKSAIVREYARWKLKKMDVNIDLRQFYLDLLKGDHTAQTISIAIEGLGETGQAEDAQAISVYFDHSEWRIVKAAVRAIASLDGENNMKSFLRLLAHESPGVSEVAKKSIERRIECVDGESLWNVLDQTSLWHVKSRVLRLLNKMSKWDRISYMLLAASNQDVRVVELALQDVDDWDKQYSATWQFSKPDAKQQDRFIRGMRNSNDNLSAKARQRLQQFIESWKELLC